MLKSLPLAASSVVSIFSSTGLIGLPAHFYAYGWHLAWTYVTPLLCIPLATHVFAPVLYRLRITSVFEYIRLRFNGTISLTACVIYIFLTLSVGALSVFAASLALLTVLDIPLVWCNVFIGMSGTLYTALGGLRGVVWADCLQFFLILVAPVTVVAKIATDSWSTNSSIEPLNHLDIEKYIANYSFGFTHGETVWSCLLGSTAMSIYRICLDQMVAQRLLASRTLKEAQRTICTGALLINVFYVAALLLGVAMTIWFRGCDPSLSGAISSTDQIMPYYVKTYLIHVPGFSGLFLSGVVSAATSTVSSIINSQAAILYVDVIVHRCQNAEKYVRWITRGTALALGISMTVYSMFCAQMGSLSRSLLLVYNSLTAPFVGLCLIGVLFPFVRAKGAGVATFTAVAFQLFHIATIIKSGRKLPRMDTSLDYCPHNHSAISWTLNTSIPIPPAEPDDSFLLSRMSYLWGSFFAIFATILLGVIVSAATGEIKSSEDNSLLCWDYAVRFWEKAGLLPRQQLQKVTEAPCRRNVTANCATDDEALLTRKKETVV
ncbi:sodium-coupled monocarboxylate transporter 2-like [Dermacentor albipictus]|uniref:sodium-coupled monocarboxylate transporter 2-like n=1 Tax=Dermacentor albipictus TaxID=60249 RepID=UPI0038FC0CF1